MGNVYKSSKKNCSLCKSLHTAYISVFRPANGESFSINTEDKVSIVFLMEGALMDISIHNRKKTTLRAGTANLLQMGNEYTFKASENRILCICFTFDPTSVNCARNLINKLTVYSDKTASRKQTPLTINTSIRKYLDTLPSILEDLYFCAHYYDMKMEELFIYMNAFYTPEQLTHLFGPLLGSQSSFKSFILSNYHKFSNINELSSRLGLSSVTFRRRFKEAFGVPASQWMRDRRKESIMEDLCLSDMTFTELAFKYGFSSSAYFTSFCKKNWNATPSAIRDKIKREPDVYFMDNENSTYNNITGKQKLTEQKY